ncbi:MAG: ATPase [Bacteroidales bacterium]|jgi:predicted Fe-Mo cluster-binding NifX family protein|nr:ATPase [Bacteroidales bacterium]
MKRIAVPINENGILHSHFGHCKYFALIDVEENKISSHEIVEPPAHEPGVLPKWLAQKGVTDVLTGGIGNRAIQNFNQQNINVFAGAPTLPSQELVTGFIDKSLTFTSNCCDH